MQISSVIAGKFGIDSANSSKFCHNGQVKCCCSSAASSHSLISVNVEDPISVVATDEMEAENLLTNETKVETLLTDGAEPNFKSEGVVLSDSDFSDSDYDIDDGDDDLYEDNVDFDVDEEAKQEEE